MEELLAIVGIDSAALTLTTASLVAARLAPLTLFAPWLTLRRTPAIIRAAIIVALTVSLAPLAMRSVDPSVVGANGVVFAGWVFREAVVGTLFAVVTSLPFFALDWAGRLVDTWRGASLSEVIAPPTGERTSPLGDLYLLLGIVFFLLLGGHRLAFRVFAEGLMVAPVGASSVGAPGLVALGAAELTGHALAFAMAIAAPAAAAIILVELSLGLLARTAPQVPVFFAGMPLRAATGLAASLLALSVVIGELRGAYGGALDSAARWLRMLGS